jgi:hypothetical protein
MLSCEHQVSVPSSCDDGVSVAGNQSSTKTPNGHVLLSLFWVIRITLQVSPPVRHVLDVPRSPRVRS